MIKPTAIAIASCLVLAACATPRQTHTYTHAEGKRASTDPVLLAQYQLDATACRGRMAASVAGAQSTMTMRLSDAVVTEMQRAEAMGIVGQGCMAERGWVYVPLEQAEAKLATLAAVHKCKTTTDKKELARCSEGIPHGLF